MSSDVINFLKKVTLQNLTLEANPWLCDCDALDFLNFIQVKAVSNPELLNVQCNGYNSSISKMTPEELCPLEITWIIAGCLTIASAGIIIGTLAAMYYRYQLELKIWMYAHRLCVCFVTEEELDREKVYDAFVSYSHKDDEFVENVILPKLEEGPNPLKLCVHTRDWLAGDWIPNQIARSVEESRRTIIILSRNFVESIWGTMEFRMAHCQALKEGRSRVIVILYGEIGPTDVFDSELRAYLNMNTYIKWGDPFFWEKLMYALPHPPKITKRRRRKFFADTIPSLLIGNNKRSDLNTDSEAPGIITEIDQPVEICIEDGSSVVIEPNRPDIATGIDELVEICIENGGSVANETNDAVVIDIDFVDNQCEKLSVDVMDRINSDTLPICENNDNGRNANIVHCRTV